MLRKCSGRSTEIGIVPDRARRVSFAGAVLLSLFGLPRVAPAGVDPFHALLRPESSQQDVGSDFEITFEVDETAKHFNGYEIRLHWDPAVLSLDSVREGSLMADACPNNFTNLVFTDSTATYSHILLCGGVSLDGPGVLSNFTFHTEGEGLTVVDLVSDPNRTFFDDGIFISPAHPTYPRQVQLFDASVVVGTAADVAPNPGLPAFEIRVSPHPVRDHARIELVMPASDSMSGSVGSAAASRLLGTVSLEISDVSGRIIRRWTIDASRETEISWKAIDGSGASLPAGAYFYSARSRDAVVSGKILVVR